MFLQLRQNPTGVPRVPRRPKSIVFYMVFQLPPKSFVRICLLKCLKSIVFYNAFATSAKSDRIVTCSSQAKKYCILQGFSASAKIVRPNMSNDMFKKYCILQCFCNFGKIRPECHELPASPNVLYFTGLFSSRQNRSSEHVK